MAPQTKSTNVTEPQAPEVTAGPAAAAPVRCEPPIEGGAAARSEDNEADQWLASGLEEAGYGYGV
jgi:hypothetical protein